MRGLIDEEEAGFERETAWLAALNDPRDPGHHQPGMLLYRLLKLSHLVLRPYFVERADAYQMSVNEMRVLTTLGRLGEAASHELCEITALHPLNVSRAVAILKRQGRLEDRRDEANRRRKLLRLTPEGRQVFEALMPDIDRAAARLFHGMDGPTLLNLSHMVDMLARNVSDGA